MLEESVDNFKTNARKKIKNRMFDIVALGVILAMMAISLGVFQLKDLTLDNVMPILIDFVPLLLTSALLTSDFYKKGAFYGKASEAFNAVVSVYSNIVASLNGRQIDSLNDFCIKYNDDALKALQTPILRKVAISQELYDEGSLDKHGGYITRPLKVLSKKELKAKYPKKVWKAILKANKCKIKGLQVNGLLGNQNNDDITDIGPTEKQMEVSHNLTSAASYTIATAFMTLIAIKDVMTWGWASLILIAFKLCYILAKSYMSYFTGYSDITVSLSNSITRKTDIIKQFKYWYENKVKETVAIQDAVIK
jgi:hypothetical protein